jgi:ribosome-binding ATPase YchF (GTP1/OBG family)
MRVGLFGFPKVGKTTLYNTLTGSSVATEAYAAGKPETHVGVATVPDARLERPSGMFHPKKTTHAGISIWTSSASKGEAAKGRPS